MVSSIHNHVKITVDAQYMGENSDIESQDYFFVYHIRIENLKSDPIQLLSRKWRIAETLKPIMMVKGEGVVGLTPVIQPHQAFTYTSGCQLSSEIGTMRGAYTFINLVTQELFDIQIPTFTLEYPALRN